MPQLRSCLEVLKPYVPGALIPGKTKMASNENPLGPSPLAALAFSASAASLQLYPDGGACALREGLAHFHQLASGNFIVGNGSDEVLTMLVASFLNPGDEVLIADHTFSEYRFASILFDGQLKKVPLDRGYFVLGRFVEAIGPRTKFIFLCSPNNPTGSIILNHEFEHFMAKVPSQTIVVMDQAYAEYITNPDYADLRDQVSRYPNLILTRTFSKIYGLAALRIGYGIAHCDTIAKILRVKGPFNVSGPALNAAQAALNDKGFFAQTYKLNLDGLRFFETELKQLGLAFVESQANFVCIDTRRNSKQMYTAISELGITIRPLESFGLEDCIRVSTGLAKHNARFIVALKQCLDAVPLSGKQAYLTIA